MTKAFKRTPIRLFCLVAIPFLAAVPVSNAPAAEIHLQPGESFEAAVESLQPGDTLIVHSGTYADSGRISIGVSGTPTAPVIIQGANGEQAPLITRNAGATVQNTINVEGASHLTIRGIEISGNGGDGINLNSNPHHITLENLEIHDIDVGINFRSDMNNIVARHNHIYRTGKDGGTGEGMYVGCNYATCAVSNSIIENNWIHDTLGSTQGDGIEIKRGSHSNVIRDNVIHDTNYPCILLYGTEGNPRNIVEGNVMWNCGDSGIQVAADTIVRNNIILESPGNGLNSQSHQEVVPANLEIINNTILGGSPCLRMHGWDSRPGLVFANNAVYCPSDNFRVDSMNGVDIAGNVLSHPIASFPSSGYVLGRSEQLDFLAPSEKSVYPTSDSTLIGSGSPSHTPAADFNGTSRTLSADSGAYTWTGAMNPGWTVAGGFKDASAGPLLDLLATPQTVGFQQSTKLSWNSDNTTECLASGAWSGMKPLSGEEDTGPLQRSSTFVLTCQNSDNVSIQRSVTVQVADGATPEVTLSASASQVNPGDSVTLTWTSANSDSCVASGSWNGPKPLNGSETILSLTSNAQFLLACDGPGGNDSASVSVTVKQTVLNPPSPGGGGASGWLPLCLGLFGVGQALRRAAKA